MAEIKLDYVNTFTDARGKRRHQFRRKGHKRITIKVLTLAASGVTNFAARGTSESRSRAVPARRSLWTTIMRC